MKHQRPFIHRRPFVQELPAAGLTDSIGSANSLTCPRCGNTYLHVIHVVSKDDDTTLDFECEGCGRGIQMAFESRKGHIFMSWVF